MNTSLRAAIEADAQAVATILIRTRMEFMPYAPAAHSEAEIRVWVRTLLIPSGGVTVAVQERAVIGVMATSVADGCSWLSQMSVSPEQVGRGVGTKLLRHALASLPPPVRLYTFQANIRGRRFYERHGFIAIAFTDGQANEERCPDVLYEHRASRHTGG